MFSSVIVSYVCVVRRFVFSLGYIIQKPLNTHIIAHRKKVTQVQETDFAYYWTNKCDLRRVLLQEKCQNVTLSNMSIDYAKCHFTSTKEGQFCGGINLFNPPYLFYIMIFEDFTLLSMLLQVNFVLDDIILCYNKKKCKYSFAPLVKSRIFELYHFFLWVSKIMWVERKKKLWNFMMGHITVKFGNF